MARAPAKTKTKTKTKAKATKGGKRAPRRKSNNVAEYASLSAKRTIQGAGAPPGTFLGNTMYEVHNIQLADYARPLNVSKAYQFYRLKHVKITYKFPYDTYNQAVGGASRPNFYYMLDKAQAIPAGINLEGLKQMGARPRQCDERPISISWSPTVLTVDETLAGPLPSQYRTSPWLSTDVPTVMHNGVYWFIEQLFPAGGFTQYQAEIEVQFEFKKPLWSAQPGGPIARGVTVAVEDNSVDGIVGGIDGNPSFVA